MSGFVITEVRWDQAQADVERVKIKRIDSSAHGEEKVSHDHPVDFAVEALDRHSAVYFELNGKLHAVERKILPGGVETIQEGQNGQGATLKQLPVY